MKNFQNEIRGQVLGRYAAIPKNLYKLSHCKILGPSEFLIFHYIFSEMYLLGKTKAHFSLNHVSGILGVSKRTVQRAMAKFDESGLLVPISNPSRYGQAYELNYDLLKLKIEALKWDDKLSWLTRVTDDNMSPTHDNLSPSHDNLSVGGDKITTNIRVIKEYILSLKGNIDASRLNSIESDVSRLLQKGFSVSNIKAAIDIIPNLENVKTFYGLVSNFGVDYLDSIDSEMTAQRLGREKKKRALEDALELAASGKVKQEPKLKFRGLN